MPLPWSPEARNRRKARLDEDFRTRTPRAEWWALGLASGEYPGQSNDNEEARALMLHYVRKVHGINVVTGKYDGAQRICIVNASSMGRDEGSQSPPSRGGGDVTIS
jgi:hypothetical protein